MWRWQRIVTKSALPSRGQTCELASSWNVPSGLEGWDLGSSGGRGRHTLYADPLGTYGQTKSVISRIHVPCRVKNPGRKAEGICGPRVGTRYDGVRDPSGAEDGLA